MTSIIFIIIVESVNYIEEHSVKWAGMNVNVEEDEWMNEYLFSPYDNLLSCQNQTHMMKHPLTRLEPFIFHHMKKGHLSI